MAARKSASTLRPEQLRTLHSLAEQGTQRAAAGLGEMIGQPVELHMLEVREVPLQNVFDLVGSPEEIVVGVYVGFRGDLNGHVALLLDVAESLLLVDLLMGEPPETTKSLDEVGLSALAEVGNLTGSFFVNALADALGLRVHVMPPAVVQDMAAAIISAIAAEVGATSDVLIAIRTDFVIADRSVQGFFLVVPDPDSLELITKGVAA